MERETRACSEMKHKMSDYYLFLTVIFPELFRGTIFLLFKNAVEIRKVVETAFVTDFCYRHGRIDQ